MKKTLLFFAFITTTPLAIIATLFTLLFVYYQQTPLVSPQVISQIDSSQIPNKVYAALPGDTGQILGAVKVADARPVIIKKYLEKYHSPLTPYAPLIISTSDKYNLDWRLLVAIAQQESNLGKKAPEGTHNAWGWGIHSKGTLGFESWEQGIETVARGIKEKYLDNGLITIEEIMARYCPNSNGSWANGVQQFVQELETGKVD